ncbi:hypothetical protein MCEGEM3_01171 [Oxalobacteraceae bacterium]
MMRTNSNSQNTFEKNYLNEPKGPLARQQTSKVTADVTQKSTRREKSNTDILIFDRIGNTGILDPKGKNKIGGLFRGASNKPWTALFGRVKANNQDVYNIFRSHGMSQEKALEALKNVKDTSNNLKLSGISSHAVSTQIENFYKSVANQP